jgi:lysophospholipase L1-like esterase
MTAGSETGGVVRVLPVLAAGTLLAVIMPGAAMASTGLPAGPATAARYVALGDSYTSGPLIPDQTGRPPGCLRSTHNYPSLVAAALGAASFTDVSCAGATTANMTRPQQVTPGINPPQLDALSARTTLVTVGIGGNNLDFAGIVINCAELSFTSPFGSPCKDHYTAGGTDRLALVVARTGPRVAAVLAEIHQRAPQARVLVVGYPDLLPSTGHGCWPLVPIAYGDVPYLRGIEKKLNAMLAARAAAGGAAFVDTYTGSIGHDFCQPPGVSWVEGLVPASPAAPMHPNARGEKAMARQVLAALAG